MAFVFQRALKFLTTLESNLLNRFGFRPPPEHFALAFVESQNALEELDDLEDKPKSSYIDELLNDCILWAVPKKRRSLEKRRIRRHNHPKWPAIPNKDQIRKTNILVCQNCGGYKEAGLLCPTCYGKVRAETEEIQKRIKEELGLSPVEQDVVVLYQGEKEQNPNYWEGKRIVEMPKERPKLFSKNLLQKTTQPLATSTDLKPSGSSDSG